MERLRLFALPLSFGERYYKIISAQGLCGECCKESGRLIWTDLRQFTRQLAYVQGVNFFHGTNMLSRRNSITVSRSRSRSPLKVTQKVSSMPSRRNSITLSRSRSRSPSPLKVTQKLSSMPSRKNSITPSTSRSRSPLKVTQKLSSMSSRRSITLSRSRSRSPLKVDKRVDHFQEYISSQPECSTSSTVVEENQLVNQLEGQIQARSTGKITTISQKSRYGGETEFEKQVVRDLIMIKFDMRAMLEIMTTMSQTWIENNAEINPHMSRSKQKPEENILPNFPLQNWENFLDLENLLQTENTARAQLEEESEVRRN